MVILACTRTACHHECMKRTERIAGAIYDVDDTLLDNNPTQELFGNLHQISRLDALHKLAAEQPNIYGELLDVQPQENFDCFVSSPVHTVSGAFFTLLKNRRLLNGAVNPLHPDIMRLLELKNEAYAALLAIHGKPITGADTFVRDFAAHFAITDKNAIASTATLRDIETFLATFSLSDFFPDARIVDVGRITHPKPHPEAFDKAFLSLGLPESQRRNVAAFEDDPRGMLSARKAGLYVCAITTRYPREFLAACEAQPDFIADNYAELREHFGLPQ